MNADTRCRRSQATHIAAVVALGLLAAACGQRDNAGTAASGSANTSTTGAMSGSSTNTATAPNDQRNSPGTGSNAAGNTTTGMPAGVGPSGNSGTTANAPLTDAERKFVTNAAAGGMFEVQTGQLAAKKASNPKVRAFGDKLAKDHGAANAELKAFAASHDITLPTTLPADKKAMMDKLSKASGAAFDKQYVQMVGLEGHKKDITMFKTASKAAQNPALKAWIDKTLPTLESHHTKARELPGAGGRS